jgi:hypothetical protein
MFISALYANLAQVAGYTGHRQTGLLEQVELHEAHRALDDREKRTQGLTLTALLLSWLYCALACLEYYTPTMDFTM